MVECTDIATLVERLRSGEIELEAHLLEARLKAIQATEDYNAFISVVSEDYLQSRIESLSKLNAAEKQAKTLFGVPLAVKDNICCRGLPMTCASRLMEGYTPTYDATVVRRLESAGAVVIGKTNLDEFAFGSSNETSAWGPVRNPHNTDRVPGGSSGGSAVAVATGIPLALGTDTGGSVRQPAAFCGVYGLKPGYGSFSRYGVTAFASSIDQVGILARDPADLRLAYEVCRGIDELDSTTVESDRPLAPFKAGMRVGCLEEFHGGGVQREVESALESLLGSLESIGCPVESVSLPSAIHSTAVYMLTAIAEASSNLSRFDGINYGVRRDEMDDDVVFGRDADRLQRSYAATRGHGFGDEARRRIMLGTFALAEGYYDAYYLRAQKVRTVIRREFEEVFKDVDLIVCPTTPTTAFGFDEKMRDPLAMYLADKFTSPVSLAGLPALSIPWGKDDTGLPIGMQLIGPRFAEERLLGAAEALKGVSKKQG